MRGKAGQTSSLSLRVFRVHNKVADSGDVVIQKQGFSIVGTHEPTIAMPLLSFVRCMIYLWSYRYQIFPIGSRQGVRRFVSLGLHHINIGQ